MSNMSKTASRTTEAGIVAPRDQSDQIGSTELEEQWEREFHRIVSDTNTATILRSIWALALAGYNPRLDSREASVGRFLLDIVGLADRTTSSSTTTCCQYSIPSDLNFCLCITKQIMYRCAQN